MKIPITLTVDHDKKILFESMKTVHGKTFTDVLAKGIDNILANTVPVNIIEIEITKKEQELITLRQDLTKAQSVQEVANILQSEIKETDEYIEKSRINKFKENKSSLTVQWSRSNINWDGFMNAYQFDNKKEARAWLQKMLMNETIKKSPSTKVE